MHKILIMVVLVVSAIYPTPAVVMLVWKSIAIALGVVSMAGEGDEVKPRTS